MIPEQVAVLIKELEYVLENERPSNDSAPPGSGFHVIYIGDDKKREQIAASPVAKKVHRLIAQILEHCMGSEGLKRYIVKSTSTFFLSQLPTVLVLVPLRSPDLFDKAKVQEYERICWDRASGTIGMVPDSAVLVEELLSWAAAYTAHHRSGWAE